MPLHMTKIAYGCPSLEVLEERLAGHGEHARIHTRYRPTRFAEILDGGSLYWIVQHRILARAPILAFEETPEGRWNIVIPSRLTAVAPRPKRAHQGWRYLAADKAPADLASFEGGEELPAALRAELGALGLV